ncbi:G-protein coupled receptor 55a isoform X2 [Pimephales promelas]|uniref:G-protein coupled receptor 55a isoform X2 n=1 Tax=Pimephales promelas TaxID=90988 RepID=UPI00195552F0|nr:G-protein coupled receptor 55a isoform X2 [Pimephales promelas]XP_039527078.1 G-protein coupled receptor 55a isoform X2 [Pimephales promelas]XP_039527079.1 G-protein coupled receptor 55a isoform X2 [Pimephales promelas]KAG1952021.1 lysophosphatidic acid receptor [Pimephales promelas]
MSSNQSSVDCDWVCWVQWWVYVPILVFGLPLNLAALWLLLFRVRRFSESTVYLINLIINDGLLIVSLPFKIHAYKKLWTLGNTFCSLLESLLYVNIYGSIMLSMCIAVDRYIALRFPFAALHLRSPRKAMLVCLVVWMVVFGFSAPIYKLHDGQNNTFCFQQFSNNTWSKSWILVSMETVFCCSALLMVFCSVRVVQILHALRTRNPGDAKLRNNKSMKIVLSNLVVFLTCFIPYHIAVLMYFHAKTRIDANSSSIDHLRYFVHISICISNVNILADGACYYFILKENLESIKRDRRMAIYVRETRMRSTNHALFSETHNGSSKDTENMDICVAAGFT